MSGAKLIELDEGVSMYVSSTLDAQMIYAEIFREGCYDAIQLPDHPFVVDVGAHIGMFILFVKRLSPAAEILAFEPAPETAGLLRQNLELLGLSDVDVKQLALGSRREAAVPFTHYPMAPGNSTRHPEDKELQKVVMARTISVKLVERVHRGHEITVDAERLSTFLLDDRPVDLLKIDVEGAELDVLLGIDPPQWPLIRQVLLEVQDLDGRLGAVCELLVGKGFQTTVRRAPMVDTDYLLFVVHAVRP